MSLLLLKHFLGYQTNHREVWDKYVEFESNVGDLPSLLKVEKKKTTAMRSNSKMVSFNEFCY